jgi:flagellar biogenesis protein FliO
LAEAEAPVVRKRAVSASRPKTTASKPASASASTSTSASASAATPAPAPKRTVRRAPPPIIDDEPATPNYALRLTEDLDERPKPKPAAPASQETFSLRLNEALAAINAANGIATPPAAEDSAPKGVRGWLAALDKLPPIRLPIGPAIPWKVGIPLLLVAVAAWGIMSRQTIQSDAPGVQLPAQPTYAAQESPLFAKPTAVADTSAAPAAPADTSAAPTTLAATGDTSAASPAAAAPTANGTAPVAPTVNPAAAATPLGVAEPSALAGFDPIDIGIKLIAVLALAYGSLMLLKRFGFGGARASRGKGADDEVRVVTSITLAPNRSVHVLKVPGGKTLLIGATPNSVNLLTELDDDDDDLLADE